ncbi:holin [Acinetobacter sp. ULE_I010]|uniref:holin n=1 Tax=Acinetobacter sp. ULE_I010 TaxID=3373065 RepID=UPI003AF7856A
MPKTGGYMQEHEKVALQLIFMGVVIAMAKVLVSTEKLTWRVVVGRSILNGFATLGAGAVLIWISDLSMLGVLGLGAFLGTLGSQFIEAQLRKVVKNKAGEI